MNKFKLLSSGASFVFVIGLSVACQQPTVTLNNNPATPTNVATAQAGSPAPAPAQNPEDAMPRVKVDEAHELTSKGTAVILDVRGSEAYKTSHIKGSIDYPLSRLEQSDFKDLPKGKRLIAYCS